MQVTFYRWCLDPKGRTPISVDPTRVEATEHFTDATESYGERHPAGTLLRMKNKTDYMVQGSVDEVVKALNAGESNESQ